MSPVQGSFPRATCVGSRQSPSACASAMTVQPSRSADARGEPGSCTAGGRPESPWSARAAAGCPVWLGYGGPRSAAVRGSGLVWQTSPAAVSTRPQRFTPGRVRYSHLTGSRPAVFRLAHRLAHRHAPGAQQQWAVWSLRLHSGFRDLSPSLAQRGSGRGSALPCAFAACGSTYNLSV